MSGLVAVYFLICPVYDPSHCVQKDEGLYLESKMCNVRSRAYYKANNQYGTITIKCRR
jgi:hypothetical protein